MMKEHPNMKADRSHIDILTAPFGGNPDWFDVVVGSNLFGDILSDLGPALTGSIGVAPSGHINPQGKVPSRFAAGHRAAPGSPGAAEAIERAIAASLVEGGPRTKDLGGNGDTKTVGAAIAELVKTA